MVIATENNWVVLKLSAEEAAILANDCKQLAEAVGEGNSVVELELRRASDHVEGKV